MNMFQLDTVGPHWNTDTSDLLVSLKQFYCIISDDGTQHSQPSGDVEKSEVNTSTLNILSAGIALHIFTFNYMFSI